MQTVNSCIFRTGVKIDDWLYYSASDRNALYRVDFDREEIEFLGNFPKKIIHTTSGSIGDEIWFVPEDGGFFDIYNVKNKSFRQEIIKNVSGYNTIGNNRVFSKILFHKGKYYIVPGAYPYVIVVSKEGVIERYIDIPEKYITKTEYEYHFNDGIIMNDWLYICPDCNKYLIRIDLNSDKVEAISWDEARCAYNKLIIYEGHLYVVPCLEKAEFIEIKSDFSGYRKCGQSIDFEGVSYFSYVGKMKDCLWFMGIDADFIIQFSLTEWREKSRTHEPSKITAYRGCIESEDAIIFPGKEKGEPIVWIDKNNNLIYKAFNEGTRGEVDYLLQSIEYQEGLSV